MQPIYLLFETKGQMYKSHRIHIADLDNLPLCRQIDCVRSWGNIKEVMPSDKAPTCQNCLYLEAATKKRIKLKDLIGRK